jgi:site-specific DNA-methyltransferase (adenine-specific)
MAAVAVWLEESQDIDEVLEAQARLAALDEYIEKRHPDHLDPVRRTARLSDVRIGELLGPAKKGRPEKGNVSRARHFDRRQDPVEFRQMAAYRDVVTLAGAVSRATALDLIKAARTASRDAAMYRWRAGRDAIDPASSVDADAGVDRAGDGWALYGGDFADRLAHLDGAVDLVVTDPPYQDDSLDQYRRLAEWASRALCPGGVLATYTGTLRLPQVLAAMDGSLDYVWTVALDLRKGSIARIFKANMLQAWKPILIFCRPDWRSPPWGWDLIESPGPSKDGHLWQQNAVPIAQLIERYSMPGWVVADPFLGAGTTGRAALDLGRQFIGCDIDARCVAAFEP